MVKIGDDCNFVSNITVRFGDNCNFVSNVTVRLRSNVTVGLRGYCEGIMMPTSRSDLLIDLLLLPTLRSYEVLIANLPLFVCLTVTSRDLLPFNRCGMKLKIGRAAGMITDILNVYLC